jgi:hypothetical protein
MPAGLLSITTVPGWPTPIAGWRETLDMALVAANMARAAHRPDGLYVGDLTFAQGFLNSYAGSVVELQWNQTRVQKALDALLDSNFDLKAFIRAGTSSAVTAANVGNFLAQITNNYRSLRTQIAAATTLAQLQAININAGWPSNP